MRTVWTLAKVVIALALAIPIALIVLGTVVGTFGILVGLVQLALKLAVLALIGVGVFKLATGLFRGSKPHPQAPVMEPLPPADPYYDSAMRELDQEFGRSR